MPAPFCLILFRNHILYCSYMKCFYFLLLTGLLAGFNSYAQNTFPVPSGNATINSTVPAQHVSGSYNALWMPNGTALMPEDAASYAGIMLTSNILRTPSNQWGFVNASLPAWRLALAHGSLNEGFSISRSNPNTSPYSEQSLFRINSAGYVGIGTATPQSLTEIRRDVRSGQGPVLELTNGGAYEGASSEIYFSTYQRDGANPSARIKVADDADWGGNMYFDTKGTDPNAPLYTRMFIDGATGNVGIGTTEPETPLVVQSGGAKNDNSGRRDVLELKTSELLASNPFKLEFDVFGASALTNRYYSINTSEHGIAYGGNLILQQFAGNVGIGTSNPDASLAVKGTIHTQEVKVDMNGWSDYVFKHAYRLRPLTEVKTYIEENHHLPDVPSEQEVLKKGVNLGEMNKVLLQKVEELTLYVIKQQEQLKQQQSQINQLKRSNRNRKY